MPFCAPTSQCPHLRRIPKRSHPRVHFPPTFPHAPSHRPLNWRLQCVTAVRYSKPKNAGLNPLLRCVPTVHSAQPRLGPSIPTGAWPDLKHVHRQITVQSLVLLRFHPMPDTFRSLPQADSCLGSTGTARTAQWTATACQAHSVGQQLVSWGRCCPLWASEPLLWARTRTHLTLSSHHHLCPRRYSPPRGQGEPRFALT